MSYKHLQMTSPNALFHRRFGKMRCLHPRGRKLSYLVTNVYVFCPEVLLSRSISGVSGNLLPSAGPKVFKDTYDHSIAQVAASCRTLVSTNRTAQCHDSRPYLKNYTTMKT
jgi:hypothetical protein